MTWAYAQTTQKKKEKGTSLETSMLRQRKNLDGCNIWYGGIQISSGIDFFFFWSYKIFAIADAAQYSPEVTVTPVISKDSAMQASNISHQTLR